MTEYQSKVLKLYRSKEYEYNVCSFLQFLNERVEIDSFHIDLVKEKIKEFGLKDTFDENQFRLLLRLIAVIQLSPDTVSSISKSEVQTHQTKKIQFRTTKKVKNTGKSSDKIDTKQKQQPSRPKEQPQRQKSQPSKETQQKPKQAKLMQLKPKQKVQQIHQQQISNQSLPNPQPTKSPSSPINYQQPKQNPKHQPMLRPQQKHLTTIAQIQNSTEINLSKELRGPKFMDMTESVDLAQVARITSYEKFSTDYVNSVIKYYVEFKGNKVLRRFSEFEKLINVLREKYEGCILPKLPPKEGIKAGMNYFWGIDEAFLEERKKKLEELLNRLLANRFVNHDKILLKFLTQQSFEIDYAKQGYGSYLKAFTDIVFNTKQLKDYGVAYYNYLKQKSLIKLHPLIQQKHTQILQLIQTFNLVNSYRKRLNTNFDKRREILHELSIKQRNPTSSKFDRMMDLMEEEIEDLTFEMENYRELKSQENWINELMKQKENDGQRTLSQLKQDKEKVEKRIEKIEKNLLVALDQWRENMIRKLGEVSDKLVQWRETVHP